MCDNHSQNHRLVVQDSRSSCCNAHRRPGCCTSRSNNNVNTTQTDTCHHHTRSREITRSNSAPAIACHDCDDTFCSSSSSHQIFRSTSRIEILLQELLDRCIEEEYTICTESCTTSRTCSGWQRTERCTICESDRQVIVSELMELLERFNSSSSTRTCETDIIRWSERDRFRDYRGRCCSGCLGGHEVRYVAQTLFEILTRITRRRSHTHVRCGGHSRRRGERHVCGGERYDEIDSTLRRLVGQLLDELEGNAGCECQSCCEYLEVNLRRMRRELRRSIECTSASFTREAVYSGSHGGCGEVSGCGGCCDSTVSKTIVYGAPPRRSRTGNVHVGWSMR